MKPGKEPEEAGQTLRQRMTEILCREEGVGARELSQELCIPEREVYAHLEHIARSLAARGCRFEVIPARCLDCGFVFAGRKKLRPPGRCPECRGTHLQRQQYRIVTSGHREPGSRERKPCC